MSAAEEDECSTPTATECQIPESASCPPAPKKPKPRRTAQTAALPAQDKAFFVPPNLEAIFTVRQACPDSHNCCA